MRKILFEYGFESVNGIVKKVYSLGEIPNIANKCDMWNVLPVAYVRQFTGLTDMDDIKAFEGDEVEVFFKGEWVYNAIIERDICNPCFVLHYKYNSNGHDCYEYDFIAAGLRTFRVIGNIHEPQKP